MKIIHCADIHLESALNSNLPYEKASLRKNELLKAFEKIVDFAVKEEIKVVIIAGDFFDCNNISRKTEEFVFNKILSADKTDFLYLKGNHDENIKFRADLPQNLRIIENNQPFKYGNVCIRGFYYSKDIVAFEKDSYNIAVMHGELGNVSGNYKIKLSDFKDKNIDYLALGHIHKRSSGKLDDRGVYAYCGNTEGRGFDECGEKGFLLLDTDTNRTEFIPLSLRLIEEVSVDITGVVAASDIVERIACKTEKFSSESIIRVVLTGKYDESLIKDLSLIKQSFEDKYFCFVLKDKSTLNIDYQSYENDISLKGEFVRLASKTDFSDEMKNKIITVGLNALDSEELSI